MTESNQDKLNIRLFIYDTEIPVKVLRHEEALYRRGATLINELLNAYFDSYKGRISDKEITYYAMIDLALRLEKEKERNDTKPFEDTLTQITNEIEDALNTK